ncbi:MAG: type V CRISPR-associated protein Cas12a/Cpf1 [Sulfurimonas sp.]
MLKEFVGKYSLSKTLRFELKPVGKTIEHIEQKGLISTDEARAEDYKKAKELIDEYHKEFIHQALSSVRLIRLDSYEVLFLKQNRDEKDQKEFEKIQDDLRKQIVAGFKNHPHFKNIDKKELIKDDLPRFLQNQEDRDLIERFSSFTTYFTGFHENRKNIYSPEAKHSSIGYRVIHENLPIFLTNKKAFLAINSNYPQIAQEAQSSLLEHLNGGIVEDMFANDYFSFTLIQTYIDIYNTMLGGKTLADGTKIQGLNELINLYRQKHNIDKRELPNLKPLHKQILSDRDGMSWIPEAFESREEINQAIQTFYNKNIVAFECCDGVVDITEKFLEVLTQTSSYDREKIFIKNDLSLTAISHVLCEDYRVIKDALWQKHLQENPKAIRSKDIAGDEERFFGRKNSYFSISEIAKALDLIEKPSDLFGYFKTKVEEQSKQVKSSFKEWELDPNNKKLTKEFLDNTLDLQRTLKPLYVRSDIDKDIAFYALFDGYFDSLSAIVKLYDKVRNFESKKPYSTEKFKLNFENKGAFLGGWVDSYTDKSDNGTQSGGYLFRKKNAIGEYDYYLGISKDTKLFRSHLQNDIDENDISEYERLDYYQLKTASVFGNSYVDGSYSEDKIEIKNSIYNFMKNTDLGEDLENYISSKEAKEATPNGMINYIKEKNPTLFEELLEDEEFSKINKTVTKKLKETILSLHRVPKSQEYKEASFNLFTEPIEAIEKLSEEKTFVYFSISSREFENALANKDKPLLLFKITNKDLSYAETFLNGKRKSRGLDNLHTLYFKALMSGEQAVFDIGTGEVFYRKKSIEYSEEKMQKGHHYDKLKEKFSYPIIKDRRYTIDKFQFHLSIIQNYKQPDKYPMFNDTVNSFLKSRHKDIKIIGIDRGERHLLYLSLIDGKGAIVEQFSLNTILNTHSNKPIDYHDKLDKKEKARAQARENWGVVENIKELKEGYMSHVIHLIAKLIVEHNAIVVLEDLNFGFKRGRFKVEKQVYQKFEKMLIDKLNFLVDKQKSPHEIGGVLNALQLTNKFVSFEKLGKQSGFLYYVPAWNTSKIDPVTGFVNLFDTRYQSIEKSREFFGKFDSIRFNEKEGYFEFAFDYNHFTQKAKDTRTKWKVCTYGTRIKTFRNPDKNNQWDNIELDLTDEYKSFFGAYSGDLKAYICSQNTKEFFEELSRLFRLTLQMRNSVTNSDIDYLISPVADKNGNFYDSRKADSSLPKDADANGAYNIARKGLMLIQKIKESEDGKKIDMKITNKEWLQFVQGV